MTLETLIAAANQQGASDLHLQPGLPAAVRVRGALRTVGEALSSQVLLALVGKQAFEDIPEVTVARHIFHVWFSSSSWLRQ